MNNIVQLFSKKRRHMRSCVSEHVYDTSTVPSDELEWAQADTTAATPTRCTESLLKLQL